jgi:hypothetical protein
VDVARRRVDVILAVADAAVAIDIMEAASFIIGEKELA